MSDSLIALRFDEPGAAYRQVTEKVRDLILAGELRPGTQLPSSVVLAREWGLNLRTVHVGMLPLVKEGLLTRTPRRGTFVQARTEKLTRVGVYYEQNVWAKGGPQFLQALHGALQRELEQQGAELDTWIDPRPLAEAATPWPALLRAAQERRIQAVIVTMTDWRHVAWLSKLPVPAAYLFPANLPGCVTTNHAELCELALQELQRQGCRSVGMIPAYPARLTNPDGSRHPYARARAAFVDRASDLGFTVREEWLCLPERHPESPAAVQRFGHEAMTALWRQPARPAGLIVRDDVAATGVVAALLEQDVAVPGQLKLVIQKNSAVDIFCPLPATYVELSTPALAAALVNQVRKQVRGERCEPVQIGFQRVPSQT